MVQWGTKEEQLMHREGDIMSVQMINVNIFRNSNLTFTTNLTSVTSSWNNDKFLTGSFLSLGLHTASLASFVTSPL